MWRPHACPRGRLRPRRHRSAGWSNHEAWCGGSCDLELGGRRCGENLAACSYDGKSFAEQPVFYHELADGVAKLSGFRGPNVFQEGYAEVFGNGLYSEETRLPIDQVLAHFERNGANYYTAGLFVRLLIERDGLDVFQAFMKRTDQDDSFERFSAIFEEEFGATLAMVSGEFDDYPSCSMWNNRLAVHECGLPCSAPYCRTD